MVWERKKERKLKLNKATSSIAEHSTKETVSGTAATSTVARQEARRRTLFATEDNQTFAVNKTDDTEPSKQKQLGNDAEGDILFIRQASSKAAHALHVPGSEERDEATIEIAKLVERLRFLVFKEDALSFCLSQLGKQNVSRGFYQSTVVT